MAFAKAQRQRAHLKIAITGPSGSGKTFGALRLAAGLGSRLALLDTENGSGSLYDTLCDYDTQVIAAPFTVQKYIDSIQEAVRAGYDVLIIDSLSHVWAGDGGLLDQKSAKDARGGNGFSNWGDISKFYEQLKSVLLQSPIHIIATMRSKQDYVIETGANNKQTPRKVGLAPIQREGMEYEFTTVFDVDMSHTAATSKDRTGLFTDEIAQITETHGRRLADWLAGAAEPAAAPMYQPSKPDSPRPDAIPADTHVTRDGTPRAERTPADQRRPAPAGRAAPAAAGAPPTCESCGKALTKAQQELSIRNYGEALCPGCQQAKRRPGSTAPAPSAPAPAQPERFSDPLKEKRQELVPHAEALMGSLTPEQGRAWEDRFEHKYGMRLVRRLNLGDLSEAIRALETGEWPYEAQFQEAQTSPAPPAEDDPFDDTPPALMDLPRETAGHGAS